MGIKSKVNLLAQAMEVSAWKQANRADKITTGEHFGICETAVTHAKLAMLAMDYLKRRFGKDIEQKMLKGEIKYSFNSLWPIGAIKSKSGLGRVISLSGGRLRLPTPAEMRQIRKAAKSRGKHPLAGVLHDLAAFSRSISKMPLPEAAKVDVRFAINILNRAAAAIEAIYKHEEFSDDSGANGEHQPGQGREVPGQDAG